MDPTLTKAELESEPPYPRAGSAAGGGRWSPSSTRSARWSWALLVVFTAIYFLVAVLTSAELAELAAIMIMGLPLGFILGIGMIVAGLAITRIYLAKVER